MYPPNNRYWNSSPPAMPLLCTVHTCVSSISHVHVNQHRQADPKMFMFSSFQHLHTALAEHFVATPEEMIYGNEDISPLTSTFAKRYVKDVRWLVQATFQESIFYPLIGRAINIWATEPSHGYKAYLQLSWIISRPWRWCMTFITLRDGAN